MEPCWWRGRISVETWGTADIISKHSESGSNKCFRKRKKAYWKLISEVSVNHGATALLTITNIICLSLYTICMFSCYGLKTLHKRSFCPILLSTVPHLYCNKLRADLSSRVLKKKSSKSPVLDFYLWQRVHRQSPNNCHRAERKI